MGAGIGNLLALILGVHLRLERGRSTVLPIAARSELRLAQWLIFQPVSDGSGGRVMGGVPHGSMLTRRILNRCALPMRGRASRHQELDEAASHIAGARGWVREGCTGHG